MAKLKIKRNPDKAIKQLEKLAKSMSTGPDNVVVGLPRGSNNYPDGTSVIMVGAVHEFGSHARNIPSRSYLRSTLNTKKRKYRSLFNKLSRQITREKISKNKALNLLGLQLQTDVRQRITDLKKPKLSDNTVKNRIKRSDNPLIDTGHLRQSIIYEVRD